MEILNLMSVSLADHWVDCVCVSESRLCSNWLLHKNQLVSFIHSCANFVK